MQKTREVVVINSYLDGKISRSFEKTRNVYKKKGGEVVFYAGGYRPAYRVADVVHIDVHRNSIKPEAETVTEEQVQTVQG